jgi:hypothetical protein
MTYEVTVQKTSTIGGRKRFEMSTLSYTVIQWES